VTWDFLLFLEAKKKNCVVATQRFFIFTPETWGR